MRRSTLLAAALLLAGCGATTVSPDQALPSAAPATGDFCALVDQFDSFRQLTTIQAEDLEVYYERATPFVDAALAAAPAAIEDDVAVVVADYHDFVDALEAAEYDIAEATDAHTPPAAVDASGQTIDDYVAENCDVEE